jgi:hypothetical protein
MVISQVSIKCPDPKVICCGFTQGIIGVFGNHGIHNIKLQYYKFDEYGE